MKYRNYHFERKWVKIKKGRSKGVWLLRKIKVRGR
jgi:hypothetical protein